MNYLTFSIEKSIIFVFKSAKIRNINNPIFALGGH